MDQEESRILIVDLDDTLIDTSSFKKILFNRLSKSTGITIEKIEEIYQKTKEKKRKNKVIENFYKELKKESKKKIKDIKKEIYSQIKFIKINRKVLNFVKRFKGDIVLLTLGEKEFQKEKIKFLEKSVKISRYIRKIIIIEENKLEFIKSLIKNGKLELNNKSYKRLTIIDDKYQTLSGIKKYSWISLVDPQEIK